MPFLISNTDFIAPAAWRACAAGLLLALLGCGSQLPVVSGVVTFDGQPLPNATVLFMPEETARSPAQGVTNGEGKYTLEQEAGVAGIQPGEYSVRISTYQPGKPDADPPALAVGEKIPQRYNLETELQATISAEQAASGASFDFALLSGGKVFQPAPDSF